MNVVITGASGFIGKNLIAELSKLDNVNISCFSHRDNFSILKDLCQNADIIFHLAGVNRPEIEEDFKKGNADFTKKIIETLVEINKTPTIVMSSSIQAQLNNPYGISKKESEDCLIGFSNKSGANVFVFRLKNVYGRWCRPNYNSVVATFCNNVLTGKELWVRDPEVELELVYIDDVVKSFIEIIQSLSTQSSGVKFVEIEDTDKVKLGDLAETLSEIKVNLESGNINTNASRLYKRLQETLKSYQ